MRIRTTRYIIKEGVINSYRNKLMSLASIATIAASLCFFGIFILLTMNLSQNIKAFEGQPGLKVYCEYNLDDTQVQKIEDQIKKNNLVSKCTTVSRAQALADYKKKLGKDADVLDGYDESLLSVSFNITLKDLRDSQLVTKEISLLKGVRKIDCPQQIIDFISNSAYWVRLVCAVLLIVLLIIATFIISNTIKLTVFARRKEINIMKYIGATDWFIRWPFVVEGVIIGFVGAVLAFIPIGWGYAALVDMINTSKNSINFIKFVNFNSVWLELVIIFTSTGSVIGALGSMMSIRKHLKV